MANKTFALEGQENSVDFLFDDDDIMIVSIDLFHVDNDGECNRNKCNISIETAQLSEKSFFNKPIICRFNSKYKDFVSDVTQHARNSNELFEMQVAGHIPSDSRIKYVKRENGKTYCNVEAVIQKKYMPQLVSILEKRDGKLKVSVEIKAWGKKDENGIFVINKFVLQGICLLGDNVSEGIEGSHLEVLKFSNEEINIMNEKYFRFSRDNVDTKDIFEQIKNTIKGKDGGMVKSLNTEQLREALCAIVRNYTYKDGNFETYKYYVEEIYPDDKIVILRDNQNAKYYKAEYDIEGTDIELDIDDMQEVERGWYERPLDEKRFALVFSKEEYGTKPEIEIDKSPEAVSEKEWGEVDKTELRHKILNAKNYKELVKSVYLQIEEGWEDSPSSKLKFPVMLIEGDKAVYARYGLSSALGYAKAENNTSVINKVEKLYELLKISEKEEKMDGEKELQNQEDQIAGIKDVEQENLTLDGNKEEELQNAEVNAPDNEELENNLQTDKDDWEMKYKELEEKYSCMEKEYSACQEELQTYKAKEDKEAMKSYLNSYKKCFSEDELKVMASKIDSSQRCEFEKEVDEKVKEFVRNMADKSDDTNNEAKEVNNSYGGTMINPNLNGESSGKRTIDDVLDNLKK